MGAREGVERGRRRNVYTGLVGQSFLLRRSFAKAQTAFNQNYFARQGDIKEKGRSRNYDPTTTPLPFIINVQRYIYRCRLSLVAVLSVAYHGVAAPSYQQCKVVVPVAEREEQAEERRRKLRDEILVLFVVVHGVSIGA